MQNSRSKKKVVRIDESARAQLKKRVNHVLYDTSPPLSDYITSLAKSKAKSPTPMDTYKPTQNEKAGLPPIQYSGVETNSFNDSSTSFNDSSTSFNDASTSFNDSSTNFNDASTNFNDSSSTYDSSYNYNMYIQPTDSIEPTSYSEPMSYSNPIPEPTLYSNPVSSYSEPTHYSEPTSYSNPITEPASYSNAITEPTSYSNPITEPTSYSIPVSSYTEPNSVSNPTTEPTSYPNAIPEPTSYPNPTTEPTSYTNAIPEPTNYPNPTPEPTSYSNSESISNSQVSTDSSSNYIDPTPIPEYKAEQGRDFDASLLQTSSKYTYDEEGPPSSEYYSSRRFEEFILNKGFLILEYFIQNKLCSFILLQLPYISESIMVYVNRKKYPIDVSNSSYPKTNIEKLKVDKLPEDKLDYENITLDGFDIQHSLDIMDDTNVQQKSLAYYLRRQLSRLMYITKNIEIKPCLIMGDLLGFHDIYHINGRALTKEFFPVISLEILFSKTFVLEQNLPVFYKKFYSIVNQSNINKMNSLEDSLVKLVLKIKSVKSKLIQQMTLETDQTRVKNILFRLQIEEQNVMKEKEKPPTTYDPVGQSYNTKRLDQEKQTIELRRHECNQIYMEIKRAYDHFVFENEISFYELYNKIQDMEELIKYLD